MRLTGNPIAALWSRAARSLSRADGASATQYPPGATNANWFGLFNAISWQITLGQPVILYAKSQGASATLLGVIAALTPLLVIFQIPAAHHLPKYGYRRFILAGWGTRTLFIFAIAVLPLLVFASAAIKLALLVGCLFAFNLIRGIASGAWMPWMSELIPDELRGRFLSRDQAFGQVGCLISLLISAAVLYGEALPWQYSLVFLISALGGTASLIFVRRIPDACAPEKMKHSGHRVPWVEMLTYPPFWRLTVFTVLYYSVSGGLAVFPVAFLKGRVGYSESSILYLAALSMVGALLTVPWAGRWIDHSGSRPALRACMVTLLVMLIGWWLVAAELVGHPMWLVGALNFLWGVVNINFNVANSRLQMATMPLMGRNHFFALFTVITSLALGLSPIGWGALLDAIGGNELGPGTPSWNRYSIYFALVWIVSAGALLYTWRLHEKRSPRPTPARPPIEPGAEGRES